MTDKENNIKSMIKLIISNIDEFDSKFVTYKADSIKRLLEDTLEYIKAKEQEVEELKEQLSIEQERYTTMRPHALELADTKLKLQKEISKFKQALDEIEKYLDAQQKYFDGEDYHNLLDIINKTKG